MKRWREWVERMGEPSPVELLCWVAIAAVLLAILAARGWGQR